MDVSVDEIEKFFTELEKRYGDIATAVLILIHRYNECIFCKNFGSIYCKFNVIKNPSACKECKFHKF